MEKLPEKKRKLNVRKAFKLRFEHHLSYREIGKQLGVRHSSVHKALKPFENLIGNPEAVRAYQNNRSAILSAMEWMLLLDMVDTEKRKSASLNNVAYAFQNIHNARRLESGRSTSNIAVDLEERLRRANDRRNFKPKK